MLFSMQGRMTESGLPTLRRDLSCSLKLDRSLGSAIYRFSIVPWIPAWHRPRRSATGIGNETEVDSLCRGRANWSRVSIENRTIAVEARVTGNFELSIIRNFREEQQPLWVKPA